MASQQQHKTAVVAVCLAALVLALPAAAYRPEATGYTAGSEAGTPAEATPTEPAVSTPAEAGTPVADGYKPGAADTTPAEATPTEAAVSTPTEASTPAEAGTPVADGYKPGAAASTPAEATPTDAADTTPAEATPTEATPTEARTPVADGYKPGAAASTPAETTPTDAAASTPAETTPTDAAASTPAETTPTDAAASTPAEATPTEAAVSTPAESGTPVAPGYTPAAAAGTTPAAESGKAKTDVQKLMEMVNAAYKKALEVANAAAPGDRFSAFDAAFNKAVNEGVADMNVAQRKLFSSRIKVSIKQAYLYTSAIPVASEAEGFSVFVSTLTEALRVMAASVDAHAVKPAAEEAIAGGFKEPNSDEQVFWKIYDAVKAAAGTPKDASLSDKYLVFETAFSKSFNDKMFPEIKSAFKDACKATVAATPEKRFAGFMDGLTEYIMGIALAAKRAVKDAGKAGAPGKGPADVFFTQPTAQDIAKPKPAAEAAYKPAAEAAAKPAGGAVGGYNL